MKANRTVMFVAVGVILAGVCLVGILVLAGSGFAFWQLALRPAPTPIAGEATPLVATPVRPVLLTPTRPPATEAELTITVTVTLTGTPGLEGTAPISATLSAETPQPSPTEVIPTGTATPFSLAREADCLPLNRPSVRANVLRVIDGVTIEVDAGGQVYEVTYLGLALPEYSQDYTVWTRAKEKNEALVGGKQVLLIQDRTDQDSFGRRPRYVLAGGVFVNAEMARSGYAVAIESPPDVTCEGVLLAAEQQAVAGRMGLWVPEPTATRLLIPSPTPTVAVSGPMVITAIAKRGTLWQEPEEWVEFRNDSQEPLQLEGWTLQDNKRHIFTFPNFVLGPGQYCRVYTNEYHSTSCGFSYWSQSPIWDNDTDCAYLKDPYDKLISTFCYGFQ